MKKITILSVTLALLFSFVFPNGSLFAVSASASVTPENPQPFHEPQLISVVSAQNSAKIIAADFSSGSADMPCLKPAGLSGAVLQNTGIINLNQPANCFSIKISRASVEPAKLSVLPLNSPPVKLLAPRRGPVMSAGDLSQAPLQSETPTLPAVSLGLIISFAAVFRKNILRLVNYPLSAARQALSLQQLQIMRC